MVRGQDGTRLLRAVFRQARAAGEREIAEWEKRHGGIPVPWNTRTAAGGPVTGPRRGQTSRYAPGQRNCGQQFTAAQPAAGIRKGRAALGACSGFRVPFMIPFSAGDSAPVNNASD